MSTVILSLPSPIVPPLTNFVLKRRYLEGVGDVYDGDVEFGEDGMAFEFDPKQL
jgi:hypothetical protein